MTTTDTITLADAEAALAALVAEQAGIDDQIAAARRAGDAVEWMRLQNRVDDLPDLIQAAALRVLPLKLAAAWVEVDRAIVDESAALGARDVAVAEHRRLIASRAASTGREGLRRAVSVELEREIEDFGAQVVEPAITAASAAHGAVAVALAAVDEIELDIERATGVHPGDDETGDRRRPPVLMRNITVAPQAYPPDLAHWFPTGTVLHLSAGERPPRWIARDIDPSRFTPKIETTVIALGPSLRGDVLPERHTTPTTRS